MELELRHLNALCVIADAGSISKAATRLGLSQPALTAQLQRVERELGAPVFHRDRTGATVTAVGEAVLARARAVLRSVEELRRAGGNGATGQGAVVRFGATTGPVPIGLCDRLNDLLPDAEIHLRTEYSPRVLWELLTSGHLDLAMLIDYPDFELNAPVSMLSRTIAVEPVLVALPRAHRLAGQERVDLAELADEAWALTPHDGAGWPDCFYAACERAGFVPRVPFTISDGTSVGELVATGRAVAPCQIVSSRREGIVVRRLAGDPVQLRHVLACHPDNALASGFDAIVQLARQVYWAHTQRIPDHVHWFIGPDALAVPPAHDGPG